MVPEVAKRALAALWLVSFFPLLVFEFKNHESETAHLPLRQLCSLRVGSRGEREWEARIFGNVAPQQLHVPIHWPEPRVQGARTELGPVEGSGQELMFSDHIT